MLETIEKKKLQNERENNYSDIIDVDNSLIINNCTNNLNLNKSIEQNSASESNTQTTQHKIQIQQ
jgi:hypothetical protein